MSNPPPDCPSPQKPRKTDPTPGGVGPGVGSGRDPAVFGGGMGAKVGGDKSTIPSAAPSSTDASVTIESLRRLMRDFVVERQWEKYHTPKNLAASISIEAAELLELYQWLTPEEAAHKSHNDQPFRKAVGEELADVLMYLMSLANALDLDIATTVLRKMEKNRMKYPAATFRGHYERPLPE